MRGLIHPISGGLAALSAATLVAFATDLATQPTGWAVPAATAVLALACVAWLLTRPGTTEAGVTTVAPQQSGGGEQSTLTHSGQGDIIHGQHIEFHRGTSEGSGSRTTRDADRETYEDIVGLVTRNEIRFLSEHDFGNVWSRSMTFPFVELAETRNTPEHEFHDEALEERRRRLLDAADKLVLSLTANSIWTKNGAEMLELVGSERRREEPPEGEHFERYEARRRELSSLADIVVEAYDDLVREARRQVP
jgi:hypothetical protein